MTCPACAARFDLDVTIADEKARKFFGLLAECPEGFAPSLIRYLRLHKPAKSALSWAKCHKVAAELVPMVKAARVERDGIIKVAPVELWTSCIDQLVNDPPKSLRLPLQGNGYLLSIVSAQAERQAASAESQREEDRRKGRAPEQRSEARQAEGLQSLHDTMKKHFSDGTGES